MAKGTWGSCDEENLLDHPGEPDLTTSNPYKTERKLSLGEGALMMEAEAIEIASNQEIQAGSRNWKIQGTHFSLEHKKNHIDSWFLI